MSSSEANGPLEMENHVSTQVDGCREKWRLVHFAVVAPHIAFYNTRDHFETKKCKEIVFRMVLYYSANLRFDTGI